MQIYHSKILQVVYFAKRKNVKNLQSNMPFPRLLLLLRKERGISQKQAAIDLGISQALLSHYEKGIRQCGLDFVVRVADYYNVSCDYLLGRTADKSGTIIGVDELPSGEDAKLDSHGKETVMITLNKKLVFNSIHVLYDMLQKCNNKALTTGVTSYLALAIYAMFRDIYEANPQNPKAMFEVPHYRYAAVLTAKMALMQADITQLTAVKSVGGNNGVKDTNLPCFTPDEITKLFPTFSASLLNLLHNAEKDLNM